MKNKFDSLQYVIACLITHAGWITKFKYDFDLHVNHFHLTKEDRLSLFHFLQKNSQRLIVSATLLQEKRWRQLKKSIPHTLEVIPSENLKNHWQKYLETFCIKSEMPSSATIESTHFLIYLSHQVQDNDLIQDIIQYELARNSASLHDFENLEYDKYFEFDILNNNMAAYCAIANPSLIKCSFSSSIVNTIQNLKSRILSKNNLATPSIDETVFFYKDPLSGKIKVIQLKENIHHAFTLLNDCANLLEWLISMNVKHGYLYEQNLSFLRELYSNGLIFIEKSQGSQYVH